MNDIHSDHTQIPAAQEPVIDDGGRNYVVQAHIISIGKTGDYFWNNVALRVGDLCVLEEDGRLEFGHVSLARRPYLATCAKKTPPGKVLRKATGEDKKLHSKLELKQKEALHFCREKVSEIGLKMSVSRVSYTFDEKKATFFFTADSRVDFRELVKELNSFTHIKVELRQIGVRDEAKMLGGCGPCGEQLCCSGFLPEFIPVSIRMAKNQQLALSPEKISGVCGRLLCCLAYENPVYQELQKNSPKLGKIIDTPDGRRGKVYQLNLLTDKVSVSFEDGAKSEFIISRLNESPSPATKDDGAAEGMSRPVLREMAREDSAQNPSSAAQPASRPSRREESPASGSRPPRSGRSRSQSRKPRTSASSPQENAGRSDANTADDKSARPAVDGGTARRKRRRSRRRSG